MVDLNLSTFFSKVGRELTEKLLARQASGVPPDLPSDQKPLIFGRFVQEWVVSRSETELAALQAICERCQIMTDVAGERAIYDVAEDKIDLRNRLDAQGSARGRALTLLLEDDDLFREAEFRRHSLHYRRGRFWHPFGIEQPIPTLPDPSRLQSDARFHEALRRAHPDKHPVNVEAWLSLTRPHEIMVAIATARPARNVQTYAAGQFKTAPMQLTHDATLAFNAQKGVIEVAGIGWRRVGCEGVAQAFVEHGLGVDVAISPINRIGFDLSALLRGPELDLDPADQIERAELVEVRFPSATRRNFSDEYRFRGPEPFWTVVEQERGSEAVRRLQKLRPTFVKLLVMPKQSIGRRATPIVASLHSNGRSNLREITEIERLVLEKYLPHWGVVEFTDSPLLISHHVA